MMPEIWGFPTYGLMFAGGSIIVLAISFLLARREGIPSEVVIDIAIITLGCGLLGARTLYVVENWSFYREQHWTEVFRLDHGGVSWFGCVLFNVPTLLVYFRKKGLAVFAMMDLFGFSVPASQFFGRIGCFSKGCCWGPRVDEGSVLAACAVRFPPPSPVWCRHAKDALGIDPGVTLDDIPGVIPLLPLPLREASWPVLPTQLLASAVGLALVVGMLVYLRRPHREGQVFFAMLAALVGARFFIELLRADNRPVWGLTEAQWLALGVFTVSIAVFVWRGRVGAPRPRPGPTQATTQADTGGPATAPA